MGGGGGGVGGGGGGWGPCRSRLVTTGARATGRAITSSGLLATWREEPEHIATSPPAHLCGVVVEVPVVVSHRAVLAEVEEDEGVVGLGVGP